MNFESDAVTWRIRLKPLLELHARRMLPDNLLLSDIAYLVTPDNIDDLMREIPTDLTPMILQWIEDLHEPEPGEVLYWPLPATTLVCLKQWLKRQAALHNP